MRKPAFAYAKTKAQISFAVTAKLISAFVFATRIVQSLHFLNTKFQASSHLLWLYSLLCVGPGRKRRRPVFSQRGSFEGRIDVGIVKIGLRCLKKSFTSSSAAKYKEIMKLEQRIEFSEFMSPAKIVLKK